MRRVMLPLCFCIAATGAMAEEVKPPLCGRPAVLTEVATQLHQAGRPLLLDPTPIGEDSSRTDRIVHCAIRARMQGYDTNRYGNQPIDDLFVIHYTLELRQNGIFIRLQ